MIYFSSVMDWQPVSRILLYGCDRLQRPDLKFQQEDVEDRSCPQIMSEGLKIDQFGDEVIDETVNNG